MPMLPSWPNYSNCSTTASGLRAGLSCFVLCAMFALSTPNRAASGEPQSAPTQNAPVITAKAGTLTRAITRELFGFNANGTRGPSFTDQEFGQAVASLHPGSLRWPGGTVGNFWDWERGWFKKGVQTPFGPAPEQIRYLYRLEEFKKLIDATGAEPVYLLNCLTMDLPNQLAMLRHARELGMAVRYVELGNEFWHPGKNYANLYQSKYPTAADYGKAMNPWIEAIKSEFPDAQVAVVGHDGGKNNQEWNRQILATVKGADATVIHKYGKTGFEIKGMEFAGDTPAEKMHGEWKQFTAPGGIEKFFTGAFNSWDIIKAGMEQYPTSWEFWLTEYNTGDNYGRAISSTWAQGLYVATQTALYMQEPRAKLLMVHQVTGEVSFTPIHLTEQGFGERPQDIGNPKTIPYSLTAMGLTFQAITRAATGMTTARKIEFTNNPVSAANNPSLVGWAFENGQGAGSAFIISLSADPLTVDIAALGLKGLQGQILYGSPETLVAAGKGSLKVSAFEAGDTLVLEPYSMAYVCQEAGQH